MNTEIQKCLLGILQRGITESRYFALTGETKIAADILDAIDNIPRHLDSWNNQSKDEILTQLSCFNKKYPGHSTDFYEIYLQRISLL